MHSHMEESLGTRLYCTFFTSRISLVAAVANVYSSDVLFFHIKQAKVYSNLSTTKGKLSPWFFS